MMEELLKRARREQMRRESRPNVHNLKGWPSFLYYLYYRNRYFLIRETGMWVLNFVELGLAAWLLGGMRVRGLALANRYVWLVYATWGGVTLAERILVGRYHAARKPERIARTVATFMQMAFVVGLAVATVLYFTADFFVSPKPGEGNWTRILFQHRSILLTLELVSSSLFMGAYTLSRMYRPLALSFLLRLWVVSMNVALFPHWGPGVLVATLYLRRIIDFVITAHITRAWVFSRHGVPRLPVFRLPRVDGETAREMAPFVLGRCLGALFAGAYGIIITQTVSWVLPGQIVLYVMFYQALDLLFLIPRRLGRCVFFDISHLLIWNRIAPLKAYIKKLDKTSLAAGLIVACMCLAAARWGGVFAGARISKNFHQLQPLVFAGALFLLFHPANSVWQAVREASGEIRFNNLLLLVTNYLIALPVNIFILTRVAGVLTNVRHSSGLEFVVVSHAMTLTWVIVVDGCLEGVRAILSRVHVFRWKWMSDSPLRVTRSLLDAEAAVFRRGAARAVFSRDLSDLWDERFLRARDEGMLSFPYWGFKVKRFMRDDELRRRGFAIVRIVLDFRTSNMWRAGGEGYRALATSVRRVDSACRVSRNTVALFLPCVSPKETRMAVAKLHGEIGIYLSGCSFAHSADSQLETMWDVLRRIGCGADAAPAASAIETSWNAASRLFHLSSRKNEEMYKEFAGLVSRWTAGARAEDELNAFAARVWSRELARLLQRDVTWQGRDEYGSWLRDARGDDEGWRVVERASRFVEATRVPDFRMFLRANARGLLPVFFRASLVGVFRYEAIELDTQAQLLRYAAAMYLWLTVRSMEDARWRDERGNTIRPVFEEMLSEAQLLEKECGAPYAHVVLPARFDGVKTSLVTRQLGRSVGCGVLVAARRGRREVLVTGRTSESVTRILRQWPAVGRR